MFRVLTSSDNGNTVRVLSSWIRSLCLPTRKSRHSCRASGAGDLKPRCPKDRLGYLGRDDRRFLGFIYSKSPTLKEDHYVLVRISFTRARDHLRLGDSAVAVHTIVVSVLPEKMHTSAKDSDRMSSD